MQVSVETTRDLERKLTVQLPSEQFRKAYEARLQSLAKTTRLAGFRPGKVPLKVIRQKFGNSVKQEILSDLVQRGYGEAVRQKNLKPAGLPQIDATPPEQDGDFKFTAVFEVYPEVKLVDLKKLSVVRPQVAVTEADIDAMLEKLRGQQASWETIERAAKLDDQVVIDFQGTIDGEPFEGGKGEGIALVLGSKRMIEGFEKELIGIKPGEARTFKVKFPKDYGNPSLQGKKAQFQVTCKEVQERVLPEVDEAFIRSFGAEDGQMETFRGQLKDHMSRELEDNLHRHMRRQIIDGLIGLHDDLKLPNVMVNSEVRQLQQQTFERLGLKEADLSQLPTEPFVEEARRRVALGLLMGEIVKQQQIKVDIQEVKTLIEKTAESYQNPEQMVQYYMHDPQARQHFENLAIENRIMEKLLAEAKVTEKPMSFDELLQANQTTK
jgi:trigger factor